MKVYLKGLGMDGILDVSYKCSEIYVSIPNKLKMANDISVVPELSDFKKAKFVYKTMMPVFEFEEIV